MPELSARPRARELRRARPCENGRAKNETAVVVSRCLDAAQILYRRRWVRVYHHTAPINMTYALREALAIVLEEGLDNRIARHAKMHQRLRAGLEAMGLSY